MNLKDMLRPPTRGVQEAPSDPRRVRELHGPKRLTAPTAPQTAIGRDMGDRTVHLGTARASVTGALGNDPARAARQRADRLRERIRWNAEMEKLEE